MQFLIIYSLPEFLSNFANCNKPMVNPAKSIGVDTPVDVLTTQKSCCGLKRDMKHYKDLNKDQLFNCCNRGFITIAHMNHTHLFLDANYSPTNANYVALFKDMQTVLYSVLQEHLTTNKGK
jgi:hypothetical protein